MSEILDFFGQYLDETVTNLVLSGRKSKESKEVADKIKIRPVEVKGSICYQVTKYVGPQVFHENMTREMVMNAICVNLEQYFKQCQFESSKVNATILISKKGKVTISKKMKKADEHTLILPKSLSHNRKKHYLIEEGTAVPFLVDLGVMTKDGKIIHAKYDKYKQINRFLEFVEDILPKLDARKEQTIIDFGCGKSYLTFAMYYYLHEVKGYDVKMIGLDLKETVIDDCNRLAEKYGYDKLTFLKGDIADYEGVSQVDMVVTLHACDTATDYALAKAVAWGSKVILSVPCCQHEVNKQIHNDLLAPVLKYGILKERISALLTDGIRAELLEQCGYHVQILEFIDMEHTPKNLLIRAVKTGKNEKQAGKTTAEEAHVDEASSKAEAGKTKNPKAENVKADKLLEELHVSPTLKKLLQEQENI